MGLGPYPLIGLAEARDRATAARRLLIDGIDPLEARDKARRAERAAVTFAAAAEQYIAGHERSWRSADHARQWRNSLNRYAVPIIGERPIDAVDTRDVLSVVEPLWQDKTETGTRVLNRIALILAWATARKLRTGDNPAQWRGHLDAVLPQRAKIQREVGHAALSYAQVPEFMARLRAQQGIGARAAELMILTATRTGEVRFATWAEIDVEARLWVIPAERMKSTRPHRVPLSEPAVALLQALPRVGERVFPGLGQHSILKAVQRVEPSVTAHGFRSAFRDWAAERTNFPSEAAEIALSHTVGDKVERAYRRGDLLDKRRALMDAWAAFCDAPQVQPADNVISIGAR
jgi:integrase